MPGAELGERWVGNPGTDPHRTCALAGCGAPIVPHDRGGRPKLYCSDAHRALARRQRLRVASAAGPGPDRRVQALEALRHAMDEVEAVLTVPDGSWEMELAELRAQATAQVLQAQRLAADAARCLVETGRRFDQERGRWRARDAAAAEQEASSQALITELRGALEATRAELRDELVRHHRDVQALQEEMDTQRPALAPGGEA